MKSRKNFREKLKKDGSLNEKFPGSVEKQKEYLEKEGHSIVRKGKKYKVLNFEGSLVEL